METVNLQKQLSEYEKWTGLIGDDSDSLETEELWSLIARDIIFDHWNELTDEQMNKVYSVDAILKTKKGFIARYLPLKSSSTPQARAEGRWWWFLNESQS